MINRLIQYSLLIFISIFSIMAQADNNVKENASLTMSAGTTAQAKEPGGSKNSSEKVNINNATVDQLTSLKGVGEQKAQSIIEYRTQHGSFKGVNDLGNIKGFSPKVLANLQKNNPDRIVVE